MKETVVLVTTDSLGKGDEELGKKLLDNFFRLAAKQERVPKAIFLLNRGVFLAASDSPVLASLNELQARGVDILSCQTCVNQYGIDAQVQVGLVVGMAEFLLLADQYRVLTLA